ncbi:MAG: glycosyltransferase family 2 protein [bacterium]
MTDKKTHRHTLISSMKDEGPYILEWVAHHLVLGFDRICVASNDCRDGSDLLLDAIAATGVIAHLPNVVKPGDIPQHAGYAAMRRHLNINDTEWLMVLDADEFLNISIGTGGVSDLTARAGSETDVVSLHAMCFTDRPEVNWRSGPVCPRFPWRLGLRHKANNAMKSLTRAPERFRDIHNHSLVGFSGKMQDLRVMDGSGARFNLVKGVPLWQQLRNTPVQDGAHKLAHYNHYGVKTWDSFALRRDRGRGAVASTDDTVRHTDSYFRERNTPEAEDHSIDRYRQAVAAQMALMLQDRAIRHAQDECDRIYGGLCAPYQIRK